MRAEVFNGILLLGLLLCINLTYFKVLFVFFIPLVKYLLSV